MKYYASPVLQVGYRVFGLVEGSLRPFVWLKRNRLQTAIGLGGSRRFEGMCRLHLQVFFMDLDPRTRRQCFLSKRRLPEDGNSFAIDQCFSAFVRPRPGKFLFHKTRARSQQIYS